MDQRSPQGRWFWRVDYTRASRHTQFAGVLKLRHKVDIIGINRKCLCRSFWATSGSEESPRSPLYSHLGGDSSLRYARSEWHGALFPIMSSGWTKNQRLNIVLSHKICVALRGGNFWSTKDTKNTNFFYFFVSLRVLRGFYICLVATSLRYGFQGGGK